MSKKMGFPTLVAVPVFVVFTSATATQSGAFMSVAHGPFYMQSYTGKCLTYGTWEPPISG